MSRPVLPTRGGSSVPSASVGRMILAPLVLCFRRLNIPLPTNLPTSPSHLLTPLGASISHACTRFERSLDPRQTLARISTYKPTLSTILPYGFLIIVTIHGLYTLSPPFPFILLRLFIPLAWLITVLIPMTSQFVWPATPVFVWLLTFFTAGYIPADTRPRIHVALLPALESVLYGANISDLQTRFTHPVLDVLAWLPYGVGHFSIPFAVAFTLWAVGPKGSIQYWGKAFGWMNLLGVVTQLLFPCAAPWYEIIHGLTPASYDMAGSPGGLMRIDAALHTGYTNTFSTAPLVFGAFPSLHAGCAVMEALFLSHFFPTGKIFYWTYAGLLWWSTMYLSHHYLIDLVGGACLSVMVFYVTMPEEYKDSDQIVWKAGQGEEGYAKVPEDDGLGVGVEDIDEEIRKLEEIEGPRMGGEEGTGAGPESGSGSGSGQRRESVGGAGKKVTFGQTEVMS